MPQTIFSPVMSSVSLRTNLPTVFYQQEMSDATFALKKHDYLPVFHKTDNKFGFIHRDYALGVGLLSNLVVLTFENAEIQEKLRNIGFWSDSKENISFKEKPKKSYGTSGYTAVK